MARLARELAALGAETAAERKVKRVLPWIASLAIHLCIVMLALFITWTVSMLPKKDDSVLIIADFNALNYEPVATMNASQAPAGERMIQDRVQSTPLDQTVRDKINESSADPLELLAGAGKSSGGAELSQFAPRPTQNGATFIGLSSSNARRIVYVIDASGSMIAYLQIVIDELARSLENLKPQQSFSIVFFQGNNAIEVPPAGKLTQATADEKSRAIKWIKQNVIPQGGTNPLVAIDKALTLKPDAVFLLSQNITGYGQFEVDLNDLLALLDKLNPLDPDTNRRKTQINCIQFLDADPLDTMKKIAQAHGGRGGNAYKFLSRKELGLGGP